MGLDDFIGYGESPASVNLGAKQGVFVGLCSLTMATLWTDDPQLLRAFVCMGGGTFILMVVAYAMHGVRPRASRSPIEQIRGVDGEYIFQTSLIVFVAMYLVAILLTNLLMPGLFPGLTFVGPL